MNHPAHWQINGPGIFRDAQSVVRVTDDHIAFLEQSLTASPTGRTRLCAHASNESPVHEMLISLADSTYVRPHRHDGKSESFHMLAGEIDIVLFSVTGGIADVIPLRPFGHGGTFFYRLSSERFHTVLVRGSRATFHETTNGPFRREDTVFAEWAPDPGDTTAASAYRQTLIAAVTAWKTKNPS